MQKEDRAKANKNGICLKSEIGSDLVDFFDLLLKIDKRNNPHLYGLEKNNKYD